MFKLRLITTLIMVPLVLLAIYHASPLLLGIIAFSLILASGWEWFQLIPLTDLKAKIGFMSVLLLLTWLSLEWLTIWLVFGLIAWAFILVCVVTYPKSKRYWGNPATVAVACLLLLPLFGSSLSEIYYSLFGEDLIVYLLCLVWAADIGAYIAGNLWGAHKLIPKVSPGKTKEGALGGLVLSMGVSVIAYFYFLPERIWMWFLLALIITFISMLGDLFFSMLKRRMAIKDTGHIIPGHGGILDRLDSLIAAAPFFCMGLRYLLPEL